MTALKPLYESNAYGHLVNEFRRRLLEHHIAAAGSHRGAAKLLGLAPTYLLRLRRQLGMAESAAGRQSSEEGA